MSAITSSLEIQVHSVDGPVTRFVQDDSEAIRKSLDQMQPGKIFAQHHLLITDHRSITIFPTTAIARVDLVMERYPDWPFPPGVSDVAEISEREFVRRCRAVRRGEQSLGAPTRSLTAFGEIELANGDRICLEARLASRSGLPRDRGLSLHHLLTAPSLHSRRRGGGVLILNPAHIVRWAFYPGPLQMVPRPLYAVPALY
jgi:hypothetical protein